VSNNPIKYTDPSGHNVCSDDGYCGLLSDTNYQKKFFTEAISETYLWKLIGRWTLAELEAIFFTAYAIQTYVDKLTDGRGVSWMKKYMGGTYIDHRGESNPWIVNKGLREDYSGAFPGWAPGMHGRNTVYLAKGWDNQTFAHELGHIWDINSGKVGFGAVEGVADYLNDYIHGDILRVGGCRFCNPGGKPTPPSSHIRPEFYWRNSVNNGYGHGSTADYLAEAFSWSVFDPSKIPALEVSLWVNTIIALEAPVR
jgi:hypothetical protein